ELTGSFFDAALRKLERIEQTREIGSVEVRLGGRDVADRALLAIGLFRDRGTLLVADHGIQGRDEDRIAVERLGEPVAIDREARDRRAREHARGVREELDAL